MKLKAKAEAVRQRFEEGQAQLYHADGSKYYADEEHEQRLSALRTERNWELREIQEEANRAIEEAQADLAALRTEIRPRSSPIRSCSGPTTRGSSWQRTSPAWVWRRSPSGSTR